MADTDATVRRRKPEKTPKASSAASVATEPELVESESESDEKGVPVKKPVLVKNRMEAEDDYTPYLDIVRVITFLFLASCGLSYLISNGETFFWGMKNPPNYLKVDWWKTQLVRPPFLALPIAGTPPLTRHS